MKKIQAVIVGASGYTGVELLRLLMQHPHVEIMALVADSNAGQPVQALYQHLDGVLLPELVKLDDVVWDDVQVAFCCLPHGVSQKVIPELPEHLKIIDLAADFRLNYPASYKEWYHEEHEAPELLAEFTYGLSEYMRDEIIASEKVACPGCYPTSALLPLLPLINGQLINKDGIIIDAKSGISGAGRSLKAPNLFTEVNENVKPYGIGGHRHLSEIEETLSAAAGAELKVTFTPQVVPVSRGMLSCIYVELVKGKTVEQAKKALEKAYKNTPFVYVCHDKTVPTMRDVAGTNMCKINIFADRVPGRALIISVIDNLVKGASGQAVQNFNLMFGFEETAGLQALPVYP